MLTQTEYTKPFSFRVIRNSVKQIPPAAASLILYGARQMSKLKFYLDDIRQYARYIRKAYRVEKILFKLTTAVTYNKPTYLVAVSKNSLKELQLHKRFDLCFVSVTLINLAYLLRKRIPFLQYSLVKAGLDQKFKDNLESACPNVSDEFGTEQYLIKNNFTAFVYDTPTTLNNFLAYYFRKQGKPVIYLQHGVYQLEHYAIDNATKSLATGFVVWGEAFRDLFIKNGVSEEKIRIACINKRVQNFSQKPLNRKLIFFGVPLTKFSDQICSEALLALKKLKEYSSLIGYELEYKPHPMENIEHTRSLFKSNDLAVPIQSASRKFKKDLSGYDLVAGFYSTGLVEAAIQKKKVLQVLMKSKIYDDFSKLGICSSVYAENINTQILKDLIHSESAVTPNSAYIRHSADPGAEYKSCITELVKNHSPLQSVQLYE